MKQGSLPAFFVYEQKKKIKENGEKGEKEKKESDLLSLHFSIFFPLSPYMFFIISLHEYYPYRF
ncbi:MAG: hypothetical protein A2889_03240 [Nitrospinae bacterium RIFCSPLOWO2_01_FULL_39_10]|nr:MAG: hypothetical protein A2889_03240 [Nitrospinae bacterium RIFCSPLOWO2_01_FULL_39_10]